jgi:hypothetical protein
MSSRVSRIRTVLLIVALFGMPLSLPATNILFLPGDAFFATDLTEERVKSLDAVDAPEFRYRGPEWIPGNFCGYAGYARLVYGDMPTNMRRRLCKVYEKLRDDYPQQIETWRDPTTGERQTQEINGFLTLIYNADYDIEQFGLLAKYNEHWPKEARGNRIGDVVFPGVPALGTVDAVEFAPFVNDAHLVMREWRFAAEVSALKVRLPQMLETETSGYPKDPATVDGPVKFVILTGKLKSYVLNKPSSELYIVTEQDTEHWKLTKGDGWKAEKLEFTEGRKP